MSLINGGSLVINDVYGPIKGFGEFVQALMEHPIRVGRGNYEYIISVMYGYVKDTPEGWILKRLRSFMRGMVGVGMLVLGECWSRF